MRLCYGGLRLLCACTVFVGVAGCQGGGPNRYAVSGEVKFQGKPLDQGAITFLAQDPTLVSGGGAMIKDGRYNIPAEHGLLPGQYRVIVTSAAKGAPPDPDAPPGPAGPLPKDRINPKYNNAQSILTAEVKAEGPNTFDFAVD
jgi:hypothetical protein